MENVVLARFDDRRRAEEAMDRLRDLAGDGQVEVHNAVLVERRDDGRLAILDEASQSDFEGTMAGGVIGALLGALAGPAGLLLGGTAGVLVGSLADEEAVREARSMADQVRTSVTPGMLAVVAHLDEESADALDRVAADLAGELTRWPARTE